MGAVVPEACRSQVPDGIVVPAKRSGFEHVRLKLWRVKAEKGHGLICRSKARGGWIVVGKMNARRPEHVCVAQAGDDGGWV